MKSFYGTVGDHIVRLRHFPPLFNVDCKLDCSFLVSTSDTAISGLI